MLFLQLRARTCPWECSWAALAPRKVGLLQLSPQGSAFPPLKSVSHSLLSPRDQAHLIINALNPFKWSDKRAGTKSNRYGHCHCLDSEGWILPNADYPERVKLDTFCMNKSSCLLQNHCLFCALLTSPQRPLHSVFIEEKLKNSLFCIRKKKLHNHLHFPRSIGTLLFGDSPCQPCDSVWDALNLFLLNLYWRNKCCPLHFPPSPPCEIKLSGIIRS